MNNFFPKCRPDFPFAIVRTQDRTVICMNREEAVAYMEEGLRRGGGFVCQAFVEANVGYVQVVRVA